MAGNGFCDAHIFEYADGTARVFVVSHLVHEGNGFAVLDVRHAGFDYGGAAGGLAYSVAVALLTDYERHGRGVADHYANVFVHGVNRSTVRNHRPFN